jgi:hypothetical protein
MTETHPGGRVIGGRFRFATRGRNNERQLSMPIGIRRRAESALTCGLKPARQQ